MPLADPVGPNDDGLLSSGVYIELRRLHKFVGWKFECKMIKASWAEEQDVSLSTVSELDRLLGQIHEDHEDSPVLVSIELSSSGDSLTIGLGRAESVLNYVSRSGDPHYWSSVGKRQESAATAFNFMGQLSEIPNRHLIPIDIARQAIRDFVQTGKLPRSVEWEQD